MKKFLYILLFAVVCSASFTSCTEEVVAPTQETNGTGGSGSNGEDPIKP